jgi:hypothetical protein
MRAYRMGKGLAVLALAALALAACDRGGGDGAPAATHGPVIPAVLTYACTDGLRFTLSQDQEARSARLVIDGREGVRQLEAAVVAQGYAYTAADTRFHAKEDGALLQLDSDPERTCNEVTAP